MARLHLGLEKALVGILGRPVRGARRETTGGDVLLQELILLVPSIAEPDVKGFPCVQWDVVDSKPAPVEVDGFRRLAAKVRPSKREELFSKSTSAVCATKSVLRCATQHRVAGLTGSPHRQRYSHKRSRQCP